MDAAQVTLRWLGAAHFHVDCGGTRIVVDPLYSRLAGEKPRLQAKKEELDRVDYLLLTHGHLDHSADFPDLLAQHEAEAYAPRQVLARLRKRASGIDWSRCHDLETVHGQTRQLGPAQVTPYQIGTEQIDFWFIRSMFIRPFVHRRLRAVPHGLRWMTHHLFCNCFAFRFELPAGGPSLLFFGNLPPDVDRLGEVVKVDVLAIPFCPANNRWRTQTLALVERFRPSVVLVHHFDNFMHPFTHSRYMDLGSYQAIIHESFPGVHIFLARFEQDVPLEEITSGARIRA